MPPVRIEDLPADDPDCIEQTVRVLVDAFRPIGWPDNLEAAREEVRESLEAGRVSLEGKVLGEPGRSVAPHERGIAMVFQDLALWPHRTVEGNLLLALGAEQEEPPDQDHRREDEVAGHRAHGVGLGGLGEMEQSP